MNLDFDQLVQRDDIKKIRQVQKRADPPESFTLTPMQAAEVERQLNQVKDRRNQGYLMIPIRQEEQILMKAAVKEEDYTTFAEEEQMILINFYKELEFVKNKMTKKQFHCFMTLEQLRRNPISRYFMTQPNPLLLKLFDYNSIIKDKLDLRVIANKLLRGKYPINDQFQIDMVKMIQNFRIYFIDDLEMYDISIKFEMLFWNYYENQKMHTEALKTYQFQKKKCTPSRRLHQRKKKKFSGKMRNEIANKFNTLPRETKVKYINQIEDGIMKGKSFKDANRIDLRKMNNETLEKVSKLIQSGAEGQANTFEELKNSEYSDNDLYFSDEEDEKEGNRPRKNEQMEKLKDILANMQGDIHYDSEDD